MARQRFIWPDIWTDPIVGRLRPEALLLFIGCFSNADDDGRLLGDPAYLKSVVFPYRKISVAQVKKLRDEIARNVPTFVVYHVDGTYYVAFSKWSAHQKPKYPKPSKIPPPPRQKRRKPAPLRQKSSGNDSGNDSPNASGSLPGTIPPQGWDGLGRDEKNLPSFPPKLTTPNGDPDRDIDFDDEPATVGRKEGR